MGEEPTTLQNNPKRPHECFEREVGGNGRFPHKKDGNRQALSVEIRVSPARLRRSGIV